MGQGSMKVMLSDGSERTLQANEIKDRALKIAFQRIERTSNGDPNIIRNRQVAQMLSANYIPEEIVNRIKLAPASISTSAIAAKDPEAKKQAFAGALDGLGLFRAFDEQGGLDALRRTAGEQAVAFFQGADIVSNTMKGGDDIAALSDMATAASRPHDDIERDVVKISRDQRLDIIKKEALSNVKGGWFSDTFVDGSLLTNLVQSTAETMVRSGLNYDLALTATSKYIGRAYESYKGMLVPKTGDKTYQQLQDFYVSKVVEANPQAARALGEMALVPSLASSAVGRSGALMLRSVDTGLIVEPLNPVTFKRRDGTELTIHDPVHVDASVLHELADVKRFTDEQAALSTRSTKQTLDKVRNDSIDLMFEQGVR
jgi:hypothetical protein